MYRSTIITWVFLLILTIVAALFSVFETKYLALLTMIVMALKFIGVAFQFTELKKAHLFWKIAILGFLFIFIILILCIL